MMSDAEKSKQDIEKLVEAQARGETVAVPTEQEAPKDAELDKRVSKGDPYTGIPDTSGS